jgi:hypothetical protein
MRLSYENNNRPTLNSKINISNKQLNNNNNNNNNNTGIVIHTPLVQRKKQIN